MLRKLMLEMGLFERELEPDWSREEVMEKLIETLSEQLQSSQERVAQLERECTLTKQRYNQQSHRPHPLALMPVQATRQSSQHQ